MDARRRWQRFFRFAALWNVMIAVPFLLFEDQIRASLGMRPPDYRLISQMLFAFVGLLGWAYHRVSLDLTRNHDIVRLGILGKLVAGGLSLVHAALGNIPWLLALPGAGDLVFAAFFLKFLLEAQTGGPGALAD